MSEALDVPFADPAEVQLTSDRADRTHLPLIIKLIIVSVFLPEGFSFFLGDLRLTVTRALFLVITPLTFQRLSQKIATGEYRFVASDALVVATVLWMFVGPMVTYSLADSLQHSGPVVLEYLISYLAMRVLLPQNGQALACVGFLCIVISFVALDGLLDTFTARYFTREFVESLTHYSKSWNVADEYRFGLLRAAGPIEHPILLGFVSGTGLLIAAAVKVRWRWFCIACCTLGVIICFSSAPEQAVVMGFLLLIYERFTRRMGHRWLLLLVLAALCVTAIMLSTDSPFGRLFDLLTIDPSTAYYRLYIWNSVGPVILENPFFAVSDILYEYHGSVDSVWLVLSLTYGIPGSVLTGLSIFGSCSLPTSPPRASLLRDEAQLGMILGIILCLTVLTGFTVHFWGSAWILTGLLVGLRAHLGELGQLNKVRLA